MPIFNGTENAETIDGTENDDVINGDGGDDTLNGLGGNDVIDGGTGADTMSGGDGDDTYHVDDAGDVVIENADEGTDTVIQQLTSYTLGDHVENLLVGFFPGASTFSNGNELANTVSFDASSYTGGDIISFVYGYGGDDMIDASALAGTSASNIGLAFYGGDGNDTLIGAAGAEQVFSGDAGDDILIAGDTDQLTNLSGGDGNDVIYGGAGTGITIIQGADGEDQLFALGSGVTSLNGGLGADLMDGSAATGNVTYSIDNAGDVVIAGSGYDLVQLIGLVSFAMGEGVDDVLFTNVASVSNSATGNDLDNTFYNMNRSVFGRTNNAAGGLGNDTYEIMHASVGITENVDEGIDTVIVASNTVTSFTLGNNIENGELRYAATLNGNELENALTGSEFADTLNGGGGNDTLYAVRGNDTLHGEAGWDTLVSGTGDDTLDGGNGRDTASYASAAAGVTVSLLLADAAQDTLGAGLDTLTSIENLRGSDFADTLTGDVDANSLWGGGDADSIHGGGGGDLLLGEDGDDTLYGDSGWDNMRGDDGDDTLWGGNGGDLMKGNAGADTFYGGDGYDRVYGGNDNDTAWGGADTDDLYGQAGDDTLYGEGGDDLLQGNNGADMLDGGADNDNLDGGSGDDTLLGGDGDDILTGSWGFDTLTGGAGADTFAFASGHTGRWEANADIITDFSQSDGDLIDLSAIDADSSTGGDDAFTFIGNAAFSGTAGELAFHTDGEVTFIAGDVDGDGVADFQIRLEGLYDLSAADFIF